MARSMNERILDATRKSLEGKIETHKVNLEILLYNSVGVAEHPNVMEYVESELGLIAEYEDKLATLNKHF